MNRRTLFVWHSWIGLTAGLLLFVICWSGTVAVFSRDLDRLMDQRMRAPAASQVAWGAIFETAQARFPGWNITQVNAPSKPGYAAETWAEDNEGVLRRIYSDPSSGEVIGATPYFNIQRFFRSFHMSLFVGELPVFGIPLGYLIVGLSSLVLLASLITSLIFYKRFWRGFWRLEFKKGAKVFWSDFHKLTGLWGLWFVALMALTGFWYLIEWKTPQGPSAPEPPGLMETRRPLPIGMLIGVAGQAYPQLRIRALATSELKNGLFEVQGQDGSLLVRDRAAKVWVHAYTGEVLAVQRPSKLGLYDRWIETADPLHFGDFGGLWTKSIWFGFGLLLSGLSLSGAYLQAKRQQRSGVQKHRLAIALAYTATMAVLVLACVYGVKELNAYGPGTWQTATSLQRGVIGLWIASTVATLTLWMLKVR